MGNHNRRRNPAAVKNPINAFLNILDLSFEVCEVVKVPFSCLEGFFIYVSEEFTHNHVDLLRVAEVMVPDDYMLSHGVPPLGVSHLIAELFCFASACLWSIAWMRET